MQASNTPMEEGWVRALINYDVVDVGAALTPRPGLQESHICTPEEDSGFTNIVAAKEQHITATEHVMQLITVAPREDGSYDLKTVTDNGVIEGPEPVGDARHDTLERYSYKTSESIRVNCTMPDKAEIHGLSIDNQQLMRHPGVFAWNENYYFFDEYSNESVHTEYDEELGKYVFSRHSPRALTPKEAVTFGYNMLLETPYKFQNQEAAAASIIQFLGLMPYDETDALCLTPVINQSLNFEVFYTVPLNAKYFIEAEWKTVEGGAWEKLESFERTFEEVGTITIPFSPPKENIIMRVTAYGYTDETRNAYADATLAVGFNFDKTTYGNTANVNPETYTVSKARGLAYWKNRLVAWGVPEDPRMLLLSEINDATYFPYPNNVDIFEEPIKYVKPLLDNLLIFTSTKLYIMSLEPDGMTWTKKCVQNNLTIADWDIHLIQTVKNMVFFRSGNYYYMMVPKVGSTTGELSLATISKPVLYLFDKFEDSVKTILNELYGRDKEPLVLKHYYNYLDFEDVHNVYVFETAAHELLNFSVLYNTVERHWRVHITGSPGIMLPYKQNMTRKGLLCMASTQNTNEVIYHVLQYNSRDNRDYYTVDYTDTDPVGLFEATHVWRNWQGIDTGYREHSSNFKKRYRELQFVINNRSNNILNFYTDFYIDGEQRASKYRYEVTHVVDSTSPHYGEVIVEQILNNPIQAPGATSLGAGPNDMQAWSLDVSSFPDTAFWKTRLTVSGKGYAPRMVLVSTNEMSYELLNVSWVYRPLYSR